MSSSAPNIALADEKIQHYEGKEFSNKADAMNALIETSQKMASVAADADLDGMKMEEIHQISYTTEDALALIDKEDKMDLSDLAAALEEVHLASEGRNVDELRRGFLLYQAKLNDYLAK